MAISVDWGTRVISVPQSDLTFVSGTLYALDTGAFRLSLKDLEDDQEGMPHPDTHNHNTSVTIAGVTYARTIEIINGYTVTFEDGTYAVRLDGSNNNIFDEGIINRNSVSIIPTNSAGLQIVNQGSGLSPSEQQKLDDIHGGTKRVIYVDSTLVLNGTGYQQDPYNNMASALTDASTNGVRQIHLKGAATITSTNISNLSFFGQTLIGSTFTLTNVTSSDTTQFHTTDVTGTLSSSAVFEGTMMRDLTMGDFIATNCLLAGTIIISGAGTSQLINCRDSSISSPIIDFATSTHTVNMRDYIGNITLRNMTAGDVAEIGVQSGQITIEASCTGGTVVIKGIGTLVNNSTTVVPDDENFIYDAGGNSFGAMG